MDEETRPLLSEPFKEPVRQSRAGLKSPPDVFLLLDCVVIVIDHAAFDEPVLVKRYQLIADSRNALKFLSSKDPVQL
jgi:hypothetical protein